MVVGQSIADHLRAELVVDALDMARWRRQPKAGQTVHHSDHGTQYTSWAFGQRLRHAGLLGSMGTVGDALDNAVAESFFATLQTELLDRHAWADRNSSQQRSSSGSNASTTPCVDTRHSRWPPQPTTTLAAPTSPRHDHYPSHPNRPGKRGNSRHAHVRYVLATGVRDLMKPDTPRGAAWAFVRGQRAPR